MAQERAEAIVLRGVDFSETSRIVTVLTPQHGRLTLIAQGARRPKSPLAAVLDTFNRVEIVYYWKASREVQRLGEASLLDGYGALKQDLDKTVYAGVALEAAYKAAQPGEPSAELYAALRGGLADFALWPGSPQAFVTWFILRLLAVTGFAPDLECPGEPGGFRYDSGVVAKGQAADRRMDPQTVDVLQTLAAAADACPGLEPGPALQDALAALRGFLVRQFESDFRSFRVIDQMF